MNGLTPTDVNFDDMPKTEDNPLGINAQVCPVCKNQSFFGMTRSKAVRHFWECYDNKLNEISRNGY